MILLGRGAMRLEEQVGQQPLDHRPIVVDFVAAGRLRPAQLEPVLRRLAIALRQSEDALADKRARLVLDQVLAAPVAEAGGKAVDEPDRPIGCAEQQRQRPRRCFRRRTPRPPRPSTATNPNKSGIRSVCIETLDESC
jgi:hypothetical protein